MDIPGLYSIIKEIIYGLSTKDSSYLPLSEEYEENVTLVDLGLDITTLPEVVAELEVRLGGRDLKLGEILNPSDLNTMTIGEFLRQAFFSLTKNKQNPLIVYVDDEEENIFVFKRKFGKRLNIKTFANPLDALAFIKINGDVALVITDEVMPILSGNVLCDEVHKFKPLLKFILITGNPNGDDDLMYKSLKTNRFYDFINKPVDFEGKGEIYFDLIQRAATLEL